MTYLRSSDPARNLTDYYPSWLDNLADNVTIEGSAMDGVADGPEAAVSPTAIRTRRARARARTRPVRLLVAPPTSADDS